MIELLKAEPGDCQFLYDLRNESEVQKQSFNNAFISYETHQIWFRNRLANPFSQIFIITKNTIRVGQIRLDKDKNTTEISISLKPEFRKQGIGVSALKQIPKNIVGQKFVAHIKEDNLSSIKLFKKSGFNNSKIVNYNGRKCLELSFP